MHALHILRSEDQGTRFPTHFWHSSKYHKFNVVFIIAIACRLHISSIVHIHNLTVYYTGILTIIIQIQRVACTLHGNRGSTYVCKIE